MILTFFIIEKMATARILCKLKSPYGSSAELIIRLCQLWDINVIELSTRSERCVLDVDEKVFNKFFDMEVTLNNIGNRLKLPKKLELFIGFAKMIGLTAD
jgi:hypothetical protein